MCEFFKKITDPETRAKWQERLFYERPCDKKGIFKKFGLVVRQVIFIITDSDTHIFQRSAALTQYTITGIIPLFACLSLLPYLFGSNISIERLADNAIPTMHNSWEQILLFAHNSLHVVQDYKFIKIGGPLIAIISTLFFYKSVQSIFSDIWGTSQRGWNEYFAFYVSSLCTTILMVVLGVILFDCLSNILPYWFLTFVITLIGFLLGYLYGPNRNNRQFGSAFISAGFATMFIIAFWHWFEYFVSLFHSSDYFKYGDFYIIFIFLIFINISWIICLSGAILCVSLEKTEWYYKRKQSEDIMLFLKFSLGLMVASCVFRYWMKNARTLTIHQIRLWVFCNKYKDLSAEEAERLSVENKDSSWLPLYLLQKVLDELVKVDILEIVDKTQYKISKNRAGDVTVGDLLFAMMFNGSYTIGYEVANYIPPLESELSNRIMKD